MKIADTNPARAIDIVSRIEMMCDFFEKPEIIKAIDDAIPHTGIVRERGALGFDTSIWVGLGTVGVWAALDAYSERAPWVSKECAICGRRFCIQEKFRPYIKGNEEMILGELDDFRHLFAHNYAGEADATYFAKKRHVLASATSAQLTCGAAFNGQRAHLQIRDLRFYSKAAQYLLKRFA